MNSLIAVHLGLVKGLISIIIINMLIGYSLRANLIKYILWTRIGYFAFWALWSMVVFSGLVVWVFMQEPQNIGIYSMITASIILPFLDGYRAIKLRKFWNSKESGLKFNLTILSLELAITIIVTILAVKFR